MRAWETESLDRVALAVQMLPFVPRCRRGRRGLLIDPALVWASVDSSLSRGGNENESVRFLCNRGVREVYVVVSEF